MTIPEEIEQLKTKLTQVTDLKDQAEIIKDILIKYLSHNNSEGETYIKRLKQLGEELKSDEYRAWSYLHTGNIFRLSANYPAALENFETAINLFTTVHHQEGLALALNACGVCCQNTANHQLALEYHQRALKIREDLSDKNGMAMSYGNIGYTFFDQGNYPLALEYQIRSLKIKEEMGDKKGLAITYNALGSIYNYEEKYETAIDYCLKAIKIWKEIGDKRGVAIAYSNVATIHRLNANNQISLEYFLKGLKIWEELNSKSGMAVSYNGIGCNYLRLGNYNEGIENLLKAIKFAQEMGDRLTVASSRNLLGDHYCKMKEFENAGNYLKQANETAVEIGFKELEKDTLKSLYILNKAEGNITSALDYHEKFIALKETIYNEGTAKKIAGMQFNYELEKKEKEKEIEQLRNVELKQALDHLQVERDRSETLLLNILPAEVAEELKDKGTAGAKLFNDVTVLFTDFKSFTQVSERLTPQQLVDELNVCFSAFDEIMGRYNIEKIKTVGDAYLAVSGLPLANPNHAIDVINAAIEIREFIKTRRKEKGEDTFDIRIGVHSGSVVAGIVGVKKFAYDIWGDTVNTAARMEQNSEAGKINISHTTYDLVKDNFTCTYRGEIEAKNKGKLKMYFVES